MHSSPRLPGVDLSKAPPTTIKQRQALASIRRARREADLEANEAVRRAFPARTRPTTLGHAAPAAAAPSPEPRQIVIEPGAPPPYTLALVLLALFVFCAGLVALAGAPERRGTIETTQSEWRDR